MAVGNERVGASQTTLRESANLTHSCAGEVVGSHKAGATNETRPSASAVQVKNEVDHSSDRSDTRSSSPVGSENAAIAAPASGTRPPVTTAAEEMLTDCKADAEILVGLGRTPVLSSSLSSPSRKRQEFDSLAVVAAAAESMRSASQSRSDTSPSSPPARRDNGEARSYDRSGERPGRHGSPSLRAGNSSHPSLDGDDGDKEGSREQQEHHRAIRFHRSERAGVERSHSGHSTTTTIKKNNAPMRREESSTPRAGDVTGHRVTTATARSSSRSTTPPSAKSDMRFLTAAAAIATDENNPLSEPARGLPQIVKTPGSPSANGETDSEHSDTTTAGAATHLGKSGTLKDQPDSDGRGEFRRTAADDPRFRRFHESVSAWDRRGGHGEVSGRRAVARSSGYGGPLVQRAALASGGGHVGYGGGSMLHERFDCV